ncbi:MAG TPA: NAD(P)/FAD-dependent oxidoreductase [Solirubrobacteraceae bacterium]|nr:NAD(P)/FAD-dependent oxidoreductase [Solirubrobacteraceae bacterium]
MNADIVVAGAGHNSLVTAAYLAASGRSVVVLESRAIPGGGAATEELMGPGYLIDSCSTGHTLIQTNPLLLHDELGLKERYGLEYIVPDPFAHVAFPDGRQLTAWMDLDRTVEEIERYSKADGAAYRRLLADYDEVKHIFAAGTFNPPGFGPSVEQLLREHAKGNIWLRRRMMSAWDVIRYEFESKHVQAFLLWQAYQTLVPVDSPGSGPLAYSIVFGRQRRSWTIPRGGSGRLTDALVDLIVDHGGTVLCGKRVARLLVEGGRCAGVQTEDGDVVRAREAVVSTIHVKHLLDMAPDECWPDDFRYGVDTFDIGVPAMGVYIAADRAPMFYTPEDEWRTAVSAGLAGFPEDALEYGRALADRRYVEDPAWVLVATPTLADPSRAPEGRHTVKLLSAQSYGFEDFKESQARRQLGRLHAVAPNFGESAILDMLVKAPEDIERANEHMIHGTFHGGNRTLPQSGSLRPAPGWAQHRMPIPGLYQTGGTTHPGGSITGAPGRNAAMVLLQDLGTSIEEVVDAGRARAVGH